MQINNPEPLSKEDQAILDEGNREVKIYLDSEEADFYRLFAASIRGAREAVLRRKAENQTKV